METRRRPRPDPIVESLLDPFQGSENRDLVAEMIQSSLNLLRDEADRGDLKVLNKAIKELRHAFKIFAPYRRMRKVSVFGSARSTEGSAEYRQAVAFGEKMASRGFMVITGAGGGVMEAAHEGAGRDRSFGVNIRVPFEQQANPVINGDPKLMTFRYFFARKLVFVKEAHALVCFPGGFGTMDEVFEALTLLQTGKNAPMPIVLLDRPGGSYWKAWDRFVRTQLHRRRMISQEDLNLYLATDDVDRACEEICGFYRVYHSLRQTKGGTVMRLSRPICPEFVRRLNSEFGDILESGRFVFVPGPIAGEEEDPELGSLHRLVFALDRRRTGRLRQVIDRINGAPDGH